MSDTEQTIELTPEVFEAFGLTKLSIDAKIAFMVGLGDSLIEMSLVRLIEALSPEQTEALTQFLDTKPSAEDMMRHFVEHHPRFSEILEEEIKERKDTYQKIFGSTEQV